MKAQDELKDKLNLANSDLLALQKRKDCDILSEEQEREFKKQKETKNGSWKGVEKKSMTRKDKKSLEKIKSRN